MTNIKCPVCNALLARDFDGTIEIRCKQCKTLVKVTTAQRALLTNP